MFSQNMAGIAVDFHKKASTFAHSACLLISGRQPDSIRTKNKLSSLHMFQPVLRKITQWKYEMCRLSSPPTSP